MQREMKLKQIILFLVILFIGISIGFDNYYPQNSIVGNYIYNFPISTVDGPNEGDQLLLKNNGIFNSKTWGQGTYMISGSRLKLFYNSNKSDFECNFYRPFFWGKPRIKINSDLNYYFSKID